MPDKIFDELKKLPQVEAICLGGSRAGENYDEKSDYDVYVYCTESVPEDMRREILEKYCQRIEIGNHFWEYEDNCVLNNGIDLDILYRDLDVFVREVADVVERYQAHNSYTTCMWHNLINSKIIFDRNGRLENAQKRFTIEYPLELKRNIIDRNMKLLKHAMPAYEGQIAKAVKRKDLVSVNHRTTEFMASYFDVIFAVNEQTHPGEKRLIELCEKKCKLLPTDFRSNLETLFCDMYSKPECVCDDIARIIRELEKILTF